MNSTKALSSSLLHVCLRATSLLIVGAENNRLPTGILRRSVQSDLGRPVGERMPLLAIVRCVGITCTPPKRCILHLFVSSLIRREINASAKEKTLPAHARKGYERVHRCRKPSFIITILSLDAKLLAVRRH